MLAKQLSALSLAIALSACATPQNNQALETEIAQLSSKITEVESALSERFEATCSHNLAQIKEDMSEHMGVELKSQLAASKKETAEAKSQLKEMRDQCREDEALDGKIIFGEVEDVTFRDEGLTMEARIDTGAETSSIGVYALTQFERDGRDWVRFKLVNLKKAPWIEYRIRNDVRIKSRVEGFTDERFEIRMDITVGNIIYRRQVFNLSNRKNFDYQALLGRSFLRDRAVVDVGVTHQLKRRKNKK